MLAGQVLTMVIYIVLVVVMIVRAGIVSGQLILILLKKSSRLNKQLRQTGQTAPEIAAD